MATHLLRTDTNERAEIREMSGVAAGDLLGALREMEAVAAGTRATKPFYHASINTRSDEHLTDEQRAHAIGRLEETLGLKGQARVIVVHLKEGREHCHIVWSRIDLEHMRTISDSHNYRKHEEVARALEKEFGHERVQGAHVERDGKARPTRTPSHDEMLATDHGAVSPKDAKALITDLWRQAETGISFKITLEENGWLLARGDRRDFVVLDPSGGTHSLARRIEGANAKDVRDRMSDIEAEKLPSVAQARAMQRQRASESADHYFSKQVKSQNEAEQLEWTNRGGMVAQQASAMEAFRNRGVKPPSDDLAEKEKTIAKLRELMERGSTNERESGPSTDDNPDRGRGRSR